MNQKVEVDLADMEKKLKCYVDKGRVAGGAEVRKEPLIAVKPDASLIKPLKKVTTYPGSFVAVDCSTRTLKRANNWGVYLMRASRALRLENARLIGVILREYALLLETHMYVGASYRTSGLN